MVTRACMQEKPDVTDEPARQTIMDRISVLCGKG
jgi:hypothetical protein